MAAISGGVADGKSIVITAAAIARNLEVENRKTLVAVYRYMQATEINRRMQTNSNTSKSLYILASFPFLPQR